MVKHLKYFNPIMGAVLIVLGILVFTNQLSILGKLSACQRDNQPGEGNLNTDNISALAVGIGVVALIAGFGIYFNSPDLNKASGQQDSFVPAAVVQENGTIAKVAD